MKKTTLTISIITILLFSFVTLKENNNIKEEYLAITIDNETSETFPTKGDYSVKVNCNNATGIWDYENWNLKLKNTLDNPTCKVKFTSILLRNLNDYIKSKEDIIQTDDSRLKHEIIIENNFTTTISFEQSDYTIVSNDTNFPYQWNDTNKTWESTNKGDDANNEISTFEFSPKSNGTYNLEYKVSSESCCDIGNIYINEMDLKIDITDEDSVVLNDLKTTDIIKITYEKDQSDHKGTDNIIFKINKGTNKKTVIEDFGYRYQGPNPNNYILFNNELWRIIGVFNTELADGTKQDLVKIIKHMPLQASVWDKDGENTWEGSSVQVLLNEHYYNSTNATSNEHCKLYSTDKNFDCDYTKVGLKQQSRNLIEEVKWNIGKYSTSDTTRSTFYTAEQTTKWTGNIGLITVSDYGYSTLSTTCSRNTNLSSYGKNNCQGTSWIKPNGSLWTMTGTSSHLSYYVFNVYSNGNVNSSYANNGYALSPSVYLKSNTKYISGDGTQMNPIIIK